MIDNHFLEVLYIDILPTYELFARTMLTPCMVMPVQFSSLHKMTKT